MKAVGRDDSGEGLQSASRNNTATTGWTKDKESFSTMYISGEATKDRDTRTHYCSVFRIKKATENFDEVKVEEWRGILN